MAQLVIIGTHQRNCPVAVRERLAFDLAKQQSALQSLRNYADEGFLISTCNRVEVGGVVSTNEQAFIEFLADSHQIDPAEFAQYLNIYSGADAVRHIFRLAAGLDSMVVGEDQIQLQLKSALAAAHDAGSAGHLIERLLQGALAAGKLVRTETGIARNPVSVVSVALDVAHSHYSGLENRRVLIVGAGRMAELALKHLHDVSGVQLTIVNRSIERAQALAQTYGASALPFDQLLPAMAQAEIVISCTSASDTVISSAMLEAAQAQQAQQRILLDLAVPRDIDPNIAALDHAILYNVDSLQPIAEANREARLAEITRAEELLEGEVNKFMEWWASQEVVPTIRALRERAEAIRASELQRTLSRLSHLSPREQEAIGALSSAIVNKLLHQPITALKNPESGNHLAQALQQLFQLSDDSGAAETATLNR